MAGRRRIQRRVRVTVAALLMGFATVVVIAAVVLSTLVWLAALLGVAAGVAATRIMYAEVTQTRWEAARDRAEQARSFRSAMAQSHTEHQVYSVSMASALRERDQTIGALGGTLRLLERRAVDAEGRARREARRANEAQQRLADLLDEVLGTADADVDADPAAAPDAAPDAAPEAAAQAAEVESLKRDLPTVVDLVGWDAKGSTTTKSDAGAVA